MASGAPTARAPGHQPRCMRLITTKRCSPQVADSRMPSAESANVVGTNGLADMTGLQTYCLGNNPVTARLIELRRQPARDSRHLVGSRG